MTKEILAYLAGVMDSDGYFSIKRNTYNVRVAKDSRNPSYYERVGIKQVQPQAIDLIHKNFGGYYGIEKPSCKNGKPLYVAQLTNLKAHKFIKSIYPYLRIKKKQVKILFQLRKSLNKGKTQSHKVLRKNRWNFKSEFISYSVTDKEIAFRENLIKQIKTLNDSRHDKTHQPIPWK